LVGIIRAHHMHRDWSAVEIEAELATLDRLAA
jgi:hypothetical protein